MADEKRDALDVLNQQDTLVTELLEAWKRQTAQLEDADSVEIRSDRGTNVKLLLQHLAVRETAIEQVTGALRERDESALADQLEADGVRRREAISDLERQGRGVQAMSLNNIDVSRAVQKVAGIIDSEARGRSDLVKDIAARLGPPEERELRSARYVRTHSPTAPSPEPKWHDRIGPIKALRALYDHLRGTPRGGTTPSVDKAREGTPGLRE